jgi:tetratricopeptide (TPR) repeat protein
VRIFLVGQLALLLIILAVVWLRPPGPAGAADSAAAHRREVAAKLKAAGVLDPAAELFAEYLETSGDPPEKRARVAYSLANTYLERGSYEQALRWLYEAETWGAGDLTGEVDQRIVETLERLGRPHAAQAALESRTALGNGTEPTQRSSDDPVVARVGAEEIYRSDVQRALDQLPPQAAQALQAPDRRRELLQKVVADRLLWRKAVKLGYDRDPEVQRQEAEVLRQLAVGRLVEREVLANLTVDETDLRTFYQAHQQRYQRPPENEGDEPQTLPFEQVRRQVEQDYRQVKAQAAYQEMVETELSTADVELFPDKLAEQGQQDRSRESNG